jgi:hypothetical protein
MSWKNQQPNNKQQQQGPPNKKTYIDSATGRKVNDYIPKFISNTPWYYSNEELQQDSTSRKRKTDDELFREITDRSHDRLKHQRLNPGSKITPNNEPRIGSGIIDEFNVINDNDNQEETDEKEVKKNQISMRKKIREWKKKGRCENCGGKHSKSECFERPHSVSYIYRDDIQNTQGDNRTKTILVKKDTEEWDIKRDRWRGVDMNEEYTEIVNNLKKKEKQIVDKYLEKNENSNIKDTDTLIKAVMENNPLAKDPNDDTIISRSLDEKPRYLEVIKTGEELRYNPKSRVYKDLTEGYLNERGQFIPYLTGEAAEFEKMKKFSRSIQHSQKRKWDKDRDGVEKVTDKDYTTEVSPTTAMLKLKEKEEKDAIIKEAKRKELLEKYGAL